MRSLKRRMIGCLCAASLLLSLMGCGGADRKATVYMELSQIPKTLDPQTAQSDSELLLVRNLFEGLLRRDAAGKIVCGCCESYKKDGMTYTFSLRKEAMWEDDEPLTANDFVFGFRRAVMPSTRSPYVSRLYAIAGAQAIAEGRAGLETLGVTATDSHTLKITLQREDPFLEETLTTAICMPCRQDFFEECRGRYGLEQKKLHTNGSYYLARWNTEDFGIRLVKNAAYRGDFTAKNGKVFFTCDEDDRVEKLRKSRVDIAFVSGQGAKSASAEGFATSSVQNRCWVLTVSQGYSASLRRGFMQAVSPAVYAKTLTDGLSAATSLFPAALSVGEAVNGVGILPYDIAAAKQTVRREIASMEDARFPSTTLRYVNEPGIRELVTAIVGHWQKQLNTFVNIKAVDSAEELIGELALPTEPFAVVPVTVKSGDVAEYLRAFGYQAAGPVDCAAVSQLLLDGCTRLPIAFQTTDVAYAKTISGVRLEAANGYLDLSQIEKKS